MRRKMRSAIDALQLIWSSPHGYRFVSVDLGPRTWLALRRLASVYRRWIIPRTCIIAIVGSLGKTTTRRMVVAGLGGKAPPQFDNSFAYVAMSLFRVRPWHREAVMEVGISMLGEMMPIADFLKPDIAVVTSVRHSEHYQTLRTLEDTRAAKVPMVSALPTQGTAIINGDDPHAMWMATQTKARVITFGMKPENEIRATNVRIDGIRGTRFTLHAADTSREVRIKLLGKHMVYTALAAVAVALERGRTLDEAMSALELVDPEPQRMQPLALSKAITVISDEYKSPLETIFAALETFAAITASRHVVVLGDIQAAPGAGRPFCREIGSRLSPWADRVLLVGSQSLKSIIAGAEKKGVDRSHFTYVGSSVHETIAILRRELKEGDAVLVKGTTKQRLERVIAALQGRNVQCRVKLCHVNELIRCVECPLLERGSGILTTAPAAQYDTKEEA